MGYSTPRTRLIVMLVDLLMGLADALITGRSLIVQGLS